jgi:glucosamine-6-phosphate deaminase
LIISPHPDDDVIGMGGTMEMMPNKAHVKILYMTNGDGASNVKGSRLKEALSAIKILGYDQTHIINGDMPFYDSKDRAVTDSDMDRFKGIFTDFKPNHIFICKDSDPKKTHDKCCEIVEKVISQNFEFLRCIWFYMGAWG